MMGVPGYVYVLQNPAFPHLLKIGFTTRTPEERAEELSRHSGVPTPYRVVFSEFFDAMRLNKRFTKSWKQSAEARSFSM